MRNSIVMGLSASAAFTLAACTAEVSAPPAPTVVALPANASLAYKALDEDIRGAFTRCDVDAEEFDRLMALPLQAFDQDFTGGWRPVGDKDGCHDAAGELVLAYIHYSVPSPPSDIQILRWHAGQMKAFAGQTDEALALFSGTYEGPDSIEWNLYVDATLAFLQQDREGVEAAYDTLAKFEVPAERQAARQRFLDENPNIRMPDGYVTDPINLPVIKRLRDCFDLPYKEAYRGCSA